MQENTVWATGRRKTSVARVRLVPGSGKMVINGVTGTDDYFGNHSRHKDAVVAPLKHAEPVKYDVMINVEGGGLTGQAEAIRLGIARALSKINPELRSKLKADGFLMRDPRMVERKKAGQPKARKKFQWTKR